VVMRCDSVRGAVLAITQGVGIGTMPLLPGGRANRRYAG